MLSCREAASKHPSEPRAQTALVTPLEIKAIRGGRDQGFRLPAGRYISAP
jgi:hypothetical protein